MINQKNCPLYRKEVKGMRVLRPATSPVSKVKSGRIMKSVPGNLK
ncbi:hypothetical protein [Rummeliibacillus sp. POC4]|nr:hypothetical protein [Rummeliibacillus sp. POC4]